MGLNENFIEWPPDVNSWTIEVTREYGWSLDVLTAQFEESENQVRKNINENILFILRFNGIDSNSQCDIWNGNSYHV